MNIASDAVKKSAHFARMAWTARMLAKGLPEEVRSEQLLLVYTHWRGTYLLGDSLAQQLQRATIAWYESNQATQHRHSIRGDLAPGGCQGKPGQILAPGDC